MRLPPAVLRERDATSACFLIEIGASEPAFIDHFPSAPILPGVVQLDWALGFARMAGLCSQRFATEFQVKFKRPIVPNSVVLLILKLSSARDKLSYEYRNQDVTVSSGQIWIVE